MQAAYSRDVIGEFWRGERSLRSLRVLLEGLPPDNAVARAHLGHSWTNDVPWLLADVVDAVNTHVTLTHNVNAPSGRQLKAPDTVPRPGMPAEADAGRGDDPQLAEVRTEMDAMRQRIFSR